jgi:hypothetical protein
MIRKLICINSLAAVALVACLFIYPPVRAALDIRDPALLQPGTPKIAWRLCKNLSPRYAKWATERVAQGRAEPLSTSDISGTEWPLFGSVFYLWGIENLQPAWDAGARETGVEPKVFAREAIVAASELVIDPKHASWVKKHWGEDYLHRENVFYRMLVIAALTSREKLLHDGAHMDLLRDQVETLAKDLDESKTGLLDDYPGECYPGDVMAAVMCIKRADVVLGTDHSTFVSRALRAFTGTRTSRYQLPPYSASSSNGLPTSEARGCANSYMCLTAPELWPAQARQWYALYDRFFWQKRITAFGFREFPNDPARARTKSARQSVGATAYRGLLNNTDWGIDVDAGPVIAGHGLAASAFGVGAARKNGRFDQAFPLAAEMLATIGELPNGVLAMPRLLSNLSDAPMLGEAAILWLLSIQPEKGFPLKTGGSIPPYVYIVLATAFLFGIWRILAAIYAFFEARRGPEPEVRMPILQVIAWAFLVLGSAVSFWFEHGLIGVALLVIALMLPVIKRKKAPKGVEDWPGEKPATEAAQPTKEDNS